MHKFSPVTLRNIDRISTPENRDAIRAYYRKCIARGLAPSGLYSNIRFLCQLSYRGIILTSSYCHPSGAIPLAHP